MRYLRRLAYEQMLILKGLLNQIKRVTKSYRLVIRWYTGSSRLEGWQEQMRIALILSREGL